MNRFLQSPRPARLAVTDQEAPRRVELFTSPACFGPSVSSSQSTPQQPVASTSGANSPATTIASGGNVQVTDGGAIKSMSDVVMAALAAAGNAGQSFLDTVGSLASQQTDATSSANANESDLIKAMIAQDQATAENTASGGQSNANQTVVYVILAALAAVAAIFIFRKR